jgi:hypothetical protein
VLRTVRRDAAEGRPDLLAPVFRDGEILRRQSFAEIQAAVRGEAPVALRATA